MDMSFGGPVPGIGKALGNLSFFASHMSNWEAFGILQSRPFFKEQNTSLKMTSRLSPSMKLTIEGTYGELKTITRHGSGARLENYLGGGSEIFSRDARYQYYIYWPDRRAPFDVFRTMQGISFDHVLSPRTFYNIRVTHIQTSNFAPGPLTFRSDDVVATFGNQAVTEEPNGWHNFQLTLDNDQRIGGLGGEGRDLSDLNTINAKFDFVSQINRYNQIKFGVMVNYDDIHTNYWQESIFYNGWEMEWDESPYRIGAFIQDKLEFEGMIANFGLRIDYNQPNSNWYNIDRYSDWYRNKNDFDLAPKKRTISHMKISPRLGISHPISTNSKVYFNYGHFYSMPSTDSMFRVQVAPKDRLNVTDVGNPNANIPKTMAYELGWEYNIKNLILVHLSGYYKDVVQQTGEVGYHNFDNSISYDTFENNNYEDIRGFEVRIDKRFGKWITGWINYNYMVNTEGYLGREEYYEDAREQRIEGLQNPYQERPLARPIARANIRLRSPRDFGPVVSGIKPLGDLSLSLLYSWRSGRYETWDPIETYELQNNLQWKASSYLDARFSKILRLGRYNLSFFLDINNLFDNKTLTRYGFETDDDEEEYFESLRLPMYTGEEYQEAGYIAGDDKPGDVKSEEKPYINMPNIGFLNFVNPRSIIFGLKFNF